MATTPVDQLVGRTVEEGVLPVLGGLARALARHLGRSVDLIDHTLTDQTPVEPPDGLIPTPDLLGEVYERTQQATDRRARGAHFTPAPVASHLVRVALAGRDGGGAVCDPTVGGGAFLLAAARALTAAGRAPDRVVASALYGADIDAVAVAVARTTLALWAGAPVHDAAVVVADTLAEVPPWDKRFSLVIGNPPFLTPLARATTPSARRRAQLKARFGPDHGPYVDAAALFCLVGLDLLDEGGRLALIQPLSFLAARDSAEVRRRLAARADLVSLWVAGDRVFGAAVEVCAPIYQRGGPSPSVRRFRGAEFSEIDPAPAESSQVLTTVAAPLFDLPDVTLDTTTTVGDRATATAGFRDEYYAIAAAVAEGGPGPGVITVGRIGPLRLDPDDRPARIHGTSYRDPRVDLDALDAESGRVGQWVRRLLVPKLLIATQTPVLEILPDPEGDLVPLTPVIVLVPPPELVWPFAALLSAPSLSAVAARRTLGTGRHSRAIKLAARQVLALPGIDDPDAWGEAADAARQAHQAATPDRWRTALVRTGELADRALGVENSAAGAWWAGRSGLTLMS